MYKHHVYFDLFVLTDLNINYGDSVEVYSGNDLLATLSIDDFNAARQTFYKKAPTPSEDEDEEEREKNENEGNKNEENDEEDIFPRLNGRRLQDHRPSAKVRLICHDCSITRVVFKNLSPDESLKTRNHLFGNGAKTAERVDELEIHTSAYRDITGVALAAAGGAVAAAALLFLLWKKTRQSETGAKKSESDVLDYFTEPVTGAV